MHASHYSSVSTKEDLHRKLGIFIFRLNLVFFVTWLSYAEELTNSLVLAPDWLTKH